MHIGYGWKLGIMQSMVAATVTLSGATFAGYVYTDDKGRETFFKKKDGAEIYIDAETSGLEYDPATGKMTSGDTSCFFENERLVKITDNYGNSQIITYADGKITNVADGAGRNFVFNYNESGFLTSVLLPDGNSVTYTYAGEILTEIILPENRGIGFYQTASRLYGTLHDVYIIDRNTALNLRKAHFNYDSAKRVSELKDYGLDGGAYVLGNTYAFTYAPAAKQTTVRATENDGDFTDTVYTYDGDGQRYTVSYDPYRNLEAVKVGSTSLVTYNYKSSAGRLKKMTYANGDYMTATYNSFGQLVTEKWFDSAETLTAHYKYIYDGEGNIVRSLDILSGKEYNYIYEKGVIARANECNVTTDGKTIVSTVFYTYDKDGKLVKKRVMSQSGEVRT